MTTREKMFFLRDNGVSTAQIARMARCSPSTINNWMRGQTKISIRLEESIDNAIEELAERINSIT